MPLLPKEGPPSVSVEIKGRAKRLIIDTVSKVSILQAGLSNSEIWDSPLKAFGVTGEDLGMQRQKLVTLGLGYKEIENTFVVSPLPTEAAGFLGMNSLERARGRISLETVKMALTGTNGAPRG
jgi:hypothetical protein